MARTHQTPEEMAYRPDRISAVIAYTENIGKYRKYTLVMYVEVRRMNTIPIGMDGTFDLTVILTLCFR